MKSVIRRSEPKYRRIQQAIMAAIQESHLQPGDRIQSERALCKIHQASLGTVQKALDRLVAADALYRRHGSGTFVKARTENMERNSSGAAGKPGKTALFRSRAKIIRLRVDSNLQANMAFWRAAAKRFADRHPFVGVEALSSQDPEATGIAFDMVECGQGIPTVQEDGSLIDLNAFSGGTIRRRDAMPTPFLAPVHMSVACMIYNRTLLEELGCSLPSAQDFQSQFAHLRTTLAHAKAAYGDSPFTSCNIGPASSLGGNAEILVNLIREGGSAASARNMAGQIDQVLELKEILLHGRHPSDYDDAGIFQGGHSPLFPATSSRILMLRSMNLPFAWGSHPFFAVDNTISCTYVGMGISRSTPNPLECLRFIEHLQSAEEQGHMLLTGMVPILPIDLGSVLLPPDRFSPQALKYFEKCLRPSRLAGSINRYLMESAIDAELYQATSAESFLNRVISLGKDYLQLVTPDSKSKKGKASCRPQPKSEIRISKSETNSNTQWE